MPFLSLGLLRPRLHRQRLHPRRTTSRASCCASSRTFCPVSALTAPHHQCRSCKGFFLQQAPAPSTLSKLLAFERGASGGSVECSPTVQLKRPILALLSQLMRASSHEAPLFLRHEVPASVCPSHASSPSCCLPVAPFLLRSKRGERTGRVALSEK